MQLHSRCKQWKVYRMKGSHLELSLDPRSLTSRLVSRLKLGWKDGHVHGNMSLFAGAVWLRFHLGVSKASGYKAHHSVFVVTFQHSPYIMVSAAGQRLTKTVCEAVEHVLRADTMTVQVTGRHVASLADLVHGQSHKTMSKSYRDKETEENPLCSQLKRKHSELDEGIMLEDVYDENRKEKRLRKDYITKKFGGQSQPELETVTYKFSTAFQGHSDLQCHSTVDLRGQSVMDGLCQAVTSGTLRWPLPRHLSAIKTRATNAFVLKGKSKS